VDEDEEIEWDGEEDNREVVDNTVFRYQKFADDIGDRNDWIKRQPEKFRKLLKTIKQIQHIESLSHAGSLAHKRGFKTTEQSKAFWSVYFSQKTRLEATEKRQMGSFATRAIERLAELDSLPKLKRAAFELGRIQKGEYVVKSTPTKWGWKQIWNAWHERRKALEPSIEL
jgi:hypothetical protein